MKKSLSILLGIIVLIVVSTSLFGCETEYQKNLKRIFETDYFRCINYEGEDTVTILELTEKGMEQEALVFPARIKGMRINVIGSIIRGESILAPNRYHTVNLKKTKKIYMKIDEPFCLDLGGAAVSFGEAKEYPKLIIITGEENNLIADKSIYSLGTTYYSNNYTEVEFSNQYNDQTTKCIINEADVFFFDNYNETPYWLDIIDESDVYIAPPIPQRREHIFLGWYLDEEGLEKWDGEYVLPEGQDALKLYAKWDKL